MKNFVNKRWGSYEVINEGKKYTVKKLIVEPNGQLSLQSHEGRSEHWLVAEGKAEVIINDETYNLTENQAWGFLRKMKNVDLQDWSDKVVDKTFH